MGQEQLTAPRRRSPSTRRFPPRTCHRKGCGCVFRPRAWNQLYCQEPECLQLLRRWQAAKRQSRARRLAEKRKQHAEAERRYRCRRREAGRMAVAKDPPQPSAPRRAWSRSKKKSCDFCDRPGCYEPLCSCRRGPAQYCGPDCGHAARRVQDRKRKFKARQRKAAEQQLLGGDKKSRPARPRTTGAEAWKRDVEASDSPPARVRSPEQGTATPVSSRELTELPDILEEVSEHDRETSPGHRPRAPPSD